MKKWRNYRFNPKEFDKASMQNFNMRAIVGIDKSDEA